MCLWFFFLFKIVFTACKAINLLPIFSIYFPRFSVDIKWLSLWNSIGKLLQSEYDKDIQHIFYYISQKLLLLIYTVHARISNISVNSFIKWIYVLKQKLTQNLMHPREGHLLFLNGTVYFIRKIAIPIIFLSHLFTHVLSHTCSRT